MRPVLAAVLVAIGAAVAGQAAAQPLSVPIDHSIRLSVVAPVASVVVGNPGVADVTVVDSRTVFVSGKAYGSTDIVLLDRGGRTVYAGDVTVTTPSSGVAIYRGAQRTEMACAPTCAAVTHVASGASAMAGVHP